MSKEPILSPQLTKAAMLHFESGVPIDNCDIRTEHRERLARVEHVYWQWIRNPFLDTFVIFKQLAKGKYADIHSEWRVAQKDEQLFKFVRDHMSPPSRRTSEQKVRVTADRLMQMGAETDNDRAMAKGAALLMQLDRLDQPESEQVDMNRLSWIAPVVTTSAKEIDETKDDMDDPEMKRIISKYNAFVDEKEEDIEKRVEVMAARGASARAESDGELTIDN
ncbi:MAG: hypothetical protein PUC18_12610 [Prevotellaceae bacterium]|nr:hypothetical protein [Prevotellaceae bacterium]